MVVAVFFLIYHVTHLLHYSVLITYKPPSCSLSVSLRFISLLLASRFPVPKWPPSQNQAPALHTSHPAVGHHYECLLVQRGAVHSGCCRSSYLVEQKGIETLLICFLWSRSATFKLSLQCIDSSVLCSGRLPSSEMLYIYERQFKLMILIFTL